MSNNLTWIQFDQSLVSDIEPDPHTDNIAYAVSDSVTDIKPNEDSVIGAHFESNIGERMYLYNHFLCFTFLLFLPKEFRDKLNVLALDRKSVV